MTIALAGLFNDQIIENIISFYNPCPEVEWEQVYGSRTIYRTNHLITFGGGPEGGFCYLESTSQAGIGGRGIGDADRLMRWFWMDTQQLNGLMGWIIL